MIDHIKAKIREVKDFPRPGIGFKDIMPLVQDGESYAWVINAIVSWAERKGPELIVGIESRGFLFAAPVAHCLGLGVAAIRKKGKLPWKSVAVRAPNEYAVEHFEMHEDAVKPGQRVVIIDDLIATGSSSISAIDLVQKLEGRVTGFASVIELVFLNGVEAIRKAHPDVEVFSLVKFTE